MYFYNLKYYQVVFVMLQNGQEFVDDSFPPAAKSLYYTDKNETCRVTQWLRPESILCSELDKGLSWSVFRKPKPSDIIQGHYKNNYMFNINKE